MNGITVLSPVAINMTEAQAIAPRIKDLNGIRVGLLNNNKPNSHLLQEHILALLSQRFTIGDVIKHQKPNASVGARNIDQYAKEVQAVITAVGDWGSCTSWCIHDSVELEKRGVPTVTLCTDAFAGLAREESKNLGMPDLPIVIIKHPLGGTTPEQVKQRSSDALQQVVDALTRELV